MAELLDTIRTRRTIRKYKEDQITDDQLNKILEAGIFAPSAGGAQRAIITAIQNKEITDALGKINVGVMKLSKGGHVSNEQPSIIDDPTLPSGFYGAPTVCDFS